jgi:hypothetical protein
MLSQKLFQIKKIAVIKALLNISWRRRPKFERRVILVVELITADSFTDVLCVLNFVWKKITIVLVATQRKTKGPKG